MHKIKPIIIYILLGIILPYCLVAQTKTTRECFSINNEWRFFKGDVPFPEVKGHPMTYDSRQAGNALGAAALSFNDSSWRLLNLPHDWSVEGDFLENGNLSQGYRERGIGWYRHCFKLDPFDKGKHLELQFDGIATNCTVWFNGSLVHRNWSSFNSFDIDISALAYYGDKPNVIAIRVDANAQDAFWYEGAGIYRNAWLVKQSSVHIITDGVYANPLKTANSWNIPVEVTIENSGEKGTDVMVEVSLFDDNEKLVAQNNCKVSVNSFSQSVAKVNIPVDTPKLWSVDQPTLYSVKTIIKQQDQIFDQDKTYCGFRTIRFDPDLGFFLNDKPLKIKGTCNHLDHAGVGVAVPASLWEFRLRKLKEMGSNAYRCSHNPPPKELLDACDRIGILVMDENRNFNVSPEYLRMLEWMVRRDRNHPSVIMWSLFNEENTLQGTESGYEMACRMRSVVRSLDTTRYVTAAMSGGLFSPINASKAVDVAGFNYQADSYDRYHQENPKKCLISTEDISCVMQRGQYVTNVNHNLLDEYDSQPRPWGNTHREGWSALAKRPFMSGGFVWTGFDYRGGTGPLKWPTVSSNYGILDLCGFPKSAYYLRQAQWIESRPILHLIPHWNWPADSIGKKIKVMAFSNVDKIKLLLNGKVIGEQVVDKYNMNTWNVPYKPGKLEAIGYKRGKEVSRFKVETTGVPVCLQLIPDRSTLTNDGIDAMPITVQALDAKGRFVPTANLQVEFEIIGAGNIIGLGNGDPNSHESDKGNRRSLYNGLAQVIVQSNVDESGNIIITAKAKGLKPANLIVNCNALSANEMLINKSKSNSK